MKSNYGSLNEEDFSCRLDMDINEVLSVTEKFPLPTMAYRLAGEEERLDFYKTLVEYLKLTEHTSGVELELGHWNTEWRKVLDRVRTYGPSIDNLRPNYFRYRTLRLDGEFVFTNDPFFEHHAYVIFLRLLFSKYLSGQNKIVDLGCGSGTSLFLLDQMKIGTELIGADCIEEAQETVNIIGQATTSNIRGFPFNMKTLEGGEALNLAGAAVITLHSMEQLGKDYQNLLDFLIAAGPSLVLHLEPIEEFYDSARLFDKLALTHHRQRGYLTGYLTKIRKLAAEKRIEIFAEKRLEFGSTWHEAYSLIVWRPI